MSVPKEVMYAINPTTAFSALAAEKAVGKQVPGIGQAIDPIGTTAKEQLFPQEEPTGGFAGLRQVGTPPTTPGPQTAATGPSGGVGGDQFWLTHPSTAGFATDPEMRKAFLQGTGPFSRLRSAQ